MSVQRHSKLAIFLHWCNAACWLFLLATGFALLDNPLTSPVGVWWSEVWAAVSLLAVHQAVGVTWIVLCGVGCAAGCTSVSLPFLREITRLSPVKDVLWCWRKALRLTIGPRLCQRLGLETTLPPQGFYNAGQKYVAIVAVLTSLGLALTGLVLLCAPSLQDTGLIQWCVWAHFVCAGLMGVALPIHIYMAACAPGEAPALKSMFTGAVPREFVRHHNPLWYEELKRQGRV